jgi:hypothetical protein
LGTIQKRETHLGFMTRKFVTTFYEKGIHKTKKSEFLIPNIKCPMNKFIGIDTGKVCQYGLVVYTGVDLEVNTIIEKIIENKLISTSNKLIEGVIKDYLTFVKSCKIGDVIELDINTGSYHYKITELKIAVERPNLP